MAARKSFRITKGAAGCDWMTEMVHAVVSEKELETLSVSTEEAAKAISRNFFPIIRRHIALAVQYDKNCFEAALVDAITEGEGPVSCLELLEKVKEATQKIKELVGRRSRLQNSNQSKFTPSPHLW